MLLKELEKMQIEVRVRESESVSIQLNQVSILYDLYEQIKEAQQEDDGVKRILEKVQIGKIQDFTCDKEMLKFVYQVCVPQNSKLKEEIMMEAHCNPYTDHSGATKMYQDLRTKFWWEGMKKDIANFVQKCLICQQIKVEHKKPTGLLMTLLIPEWKCQKQSYRKEILSFYQNFG